MSRSLSIGIYIGDWSPPRIRYFGVKGGVKPKISLAAVKSGKNVPFPLKVSGMIEKSLWEDVLRSKVGCFGSFHVRKGALKSVVGPSNTSVCRPALAIPWGLAPSSLSIGIYIGDWSHL